MKDLRKTHTFVVCAYKESPYLEECLHSLMAQSVKSSIIMITSTPNDFIRGLAQRYRISLFYHEGPKGIVPDWNFAYEKCTTPYVTIAHQDDIYFPRYTARAIKALRQSKKPLIFFSDYQEIREDQAIPSNFLLFVKRLMLLPLRINSFQSSKFIRRRILSFGCPICCPAVTFATDNLPRPIFSTGFRSCEDWEAWERLSKLTGDFVYDSLELMAHRIHKESETTNIINDGDRNKEDYQMFLKFWPKGMARLLTRLYAIGEHSNQL